MEKNSPININQKVLERINSGSIKMRSRWTFVAEKIGLESGMLLAFVTAVFVTSLFLHYWEVNELHKYFAFGSKGVWRVVFNFPYELIAIAMAVLVLINYLVKKMDWGYKRSWLVWTGVSVAALSVLSAAAFFVGFHEMVEENSNNIPALSGFYQGRIKNLANQKISGVISALSSRQITINASGTAPIVFNEDGIKVEPKSAKPAVGERVELIGNWSNGAFEPWEMSIISQKSAKNSKWHDFQSRLRK